MSAIALGLAVVVLLLATWARSRRRAAPSPRQEPSPRTIEAQPTGGDATPLEHLSLDELAAVFALPESNDDEAATLLYRGQVFAETAPGKTPSAAPPRDDTPSLVELCYEEQAEQTDVTAPQARILLAAKGDSDVGKRRRENEDSVLFVPERGLFAVADGMGGYAGGRIASTLAVDRLRDAFERESFVGPLDSKLELPRRGRELASAVVQSNVAVRDAAQAAPELANMGTTLVAARFSPNNQRLYVAHVGDSRCYRLRGGQLRQLTVDHTMRQVGLNGPGADHLFQAIGVTKRLTIDLIVDKPLPNDVYLLCSDGLSKMVPDSQIRETLLGEADIEAAVYELIERANDNGGRDNVSVVLVKVLERPVSAFVPAEAPWSKLPSNSNAIWETGSDEPTASTAELDPDGPTLLRRANDK